MIIKVPDWCRIGSEIEFQMFDPTAGKKQWFRDTIISYSEDGFFHKSKYCPVYHHKFSDFGKTVRSAECMRL